MPLLVDLDAARERQFGSLTRGVLETVPDQDFGEVLMTADLAGDVDVGLGAADAPNVVLDQHECDAVLDGVLPAAPPVLA